MKAKLLTSLAVGMLFGCAISQVTMQAQAFAQAKAKARQQQWEYKVVYCNAVGRTEPLALEMTLQFNKLAANGWEYVGPVVEWTLEDMRGPTEESAANISSSNGQRDRSVSGVG
jgi:hypothetical protein